MEFIDYIFADDKQGMVYVLGEKGNAKSAATDLGFMVRFAGDKRLPAIGLGRFFPHDALVDSTRGLFYVRGTVPESAERAIAGFYSLQGEIQVWRGQERMSTLSINSAYDLWVIDPATGAVFFVIDDQVLHKTVLRRYDGTAVQDVDYPLVNGASRSCATRGGGAMGVSSKDGRIYVADGCQRAILVFKDMAFEGFLPSDARDIYTIVVDQNRAIAYVPDIRNDKVIALRLSLIHI